jgi:hypothetical protein
VNAHAVPGVPLPRPKLQLYRRVGAGKYAERALSRAEGNCNAIIFIEPEFSVALPAFTDRPFHHRLPASDGQCRNQSGDRR